MYHTFFSIHTAEIVVELQMGKIRFSILIKFESLFQIESYIEEAYQIPDRMYPPYFHIQFIS